MKTKPRLRRKSDGWYRLVLTFASGRVDFKTKQRIPDEFGCTERELWVGPFLTAEDAFLYEPFKIFDQYRKPRKSENFYEHK